MGWDVVASRLAQIPESLLVKLWRERASREKYLRSGDGRRFKVLYPGRTGTTAGPDFRDAVLEEEGVGLVRGDVEVHVSQRDWDAHGHSKDPRYNGVVLHVVGDTGTGPTTLRSGNRVPVLSLKPLLQGRTPPGGGPSLWPLLKAHGYIPPGNARELGVLLDEAGDSRFLGKSESFLAFLKEEDHEQVLYAALMEALGYSQNREPFLELAYRVPYRRLEKPALKSPPGERIEAIQKTLLTAAGFLPSSSNRRAMDQGQWHLFRVRPQNHPRQRIMGFAHVLDTFLPSSSESEGGPESGANKGLVEGMAGLVRTGPDTAQEGNRWNALESGLMGTRPPPTGETPGDSAKRRPAAIGKGRARDIAVNCVLPFIHAKARLHDDARLAQLASEVYRSFPSLQENELTREMRQQLLSPLSVGNDGKSGGDGDRASIEWKRIVANARRQQGLLHLHYLISSLG